MYNGKHADIFFHDLDKYLKRATDRHRGSWYGRVFSFDVLRAVSNFGAEVEQCNHSGSPRDQARYVRKAALQACTAIYYVVVMVENFSRGRHG